MRYLLAVVLVWLFGCGGATEETYQVSGNATPIHGDVTFSQLERLQIEQGAAFIQLRAPRHPLVIVWDAPHVPHPGCPANQIQRDTDGKGARTGEATDGPGYCIRMSVLEAWPGRLEAIAAHEFGHWVGLGHTATGVMYYSYNNLEWTGDVQRECQRVGLCEATDVTPGYTGNISGE